MTVPRRFTQGEGVRVWVYFEDPVTGARADPVLPVVVTIDPPLPTATRTVTATRHVAGEFFVDTAGDVVGKYAVRGQSSGPVEGRGVWEGGFEVVASRMRP